MSEQFKCEECSKEFNSFDSLNQHNRSKHYERFKPPKKSVQLPVKKIIKWAIAILIFVLLVWGVTISINNSTKNKTVIDESNLNFESPKNAIHWHPKLTIIINGKNTPIPADIGLTGGHKPTHTHEPDGVLHMENNFPTKKTVTLGYFFEVWGKKLSKDCIFEYCTDKGTLKMTVNGEENFEFENYFMQDEDQIIIEYVSGDKNE